MDVNLFRCSSLMLNGPLVSHHKGLKTNVTGKQNQPQLLHKLHHQFVNKQTDLLLPKMLTNLSPVDYS